MPKGGAKGLRIGSMSNGFLFHNQNKPEKQAFESPYCLQSRRLWMGGRDVAVKKEKKILCNQKKGVHLLN